MTAGEHGAPTLDASARTLGARAMIDVPGDAADIVEPGRPRAFGGTGADPVYAADVANLGGDLVWRPDPDGPFGPWLCRTCA